MTLHFQYIYIDFSYKYIRIKWKPIEKTSSQNCVNIPIYLNFAENYDDQAILSNYFYFKQVLSGGHLKSVIDLVNAMWSY